MVLYRHVLRMNEEQGVKRAWMVPVRGRRLRGVGQRIRWNDKVKEDLQKGRVKEDAFDSNSW